MLQLPLTDRQIPVIADEYVDMDFGTGCVKITPAHDPNDFEVGKRHGLEEICILNDDATINEKGGKYAGMDRYEARKLMVSELEEQGLLVRVVPHSHAVGTHDRCGTTVEPMIKQQWFVRMHEMAQPAIEAIKTGELTFVPQSGDASFSIDDVTIGVHFHWERKETQVFQGVLRLVVEADKICAINELPVENYLTSVISSEMNATSSPEFLKAHAVISRSWLLAQMEKRKQLKDGTNSFFSFIKKDDELIRWYDREDHSIFDVCADDHCQRYQGITKATNNHVAEAVRDTRGQILMFGDEICDARFSKCCGGVTEEFQYCWEDTPKPYLVSVPDTADAANPAAEPFCNTHDERILKQVLNDYDQETPDFYRWEVSYTQEQLSALEWAHLEAQNRGNRQGIHHR